VGDAAYRRPHPCTHGHSAESENENGAAQSGDEELPPQCVPSVAALFDGQIPTCVQKRGPDCEKSGPEHVLNVLVTPSPRSGP
jgi:hypothetical protein